MKELIVALSDVLATQESVRVSVLSGEMSEEEVIHNYLRLQKTIERFENVFNTLVDTRIKLLAGETA